MNKNDAEMELNYEQVLKKIETMDKEFNTECEKTKIGIVFAVMVFIGYIIGLILLTTRHIHQ